jgi:hypothetical protein
MSVSLSLSCVSVVWGIDLNNYLSSLTLSPPFVFS